MDAIGMSHIAICVRDMDKSLGFYRDILGMEVTFDGPTPIRPKEGAPTTTSTPARPAGASA